MSIGAIYIDAKMSHSIYLVDLLRQTVKMVLARGNKLMPYQEYYMALQTPELNVVPIAPQITKAKTPEESLFLLLRNYIQQNFTKRVDNDSPYFRLNMSDLFFKDSQDGTKSNITFVFFGATKNNMDVKVEDFNHFIGTLEHVKKIIYDMNIALSKVQGYKTYVLDSIVYITKNNMVNPTAIKLNVIAHNENAVHFLDQEVSDPSEHVYSGRFRVLEGSDLAEYKSNNLNNNKIPQIASNEACVKYYNARPGDVIETISQTMIPGFMVEYKTVYRTVKHPYEKKKVKIV